MQNVHTFVRTLKTDKMGMIGHTTLGQLADSTGRTTEAMRKYFVRTAQRHPEVFPDKAFSVNRPLSPEQVEILSRRHAGKRPVVVRSEPAPRKAKPVKEPLAIESPEPEARETPVVARSGWQKTLLYGLLLAPTAASVHNIFVVTLHISGTVLDAVLLTVVLACTAIGFILAGVRNTWTFALAVLLIGFESFCNLTKIYGGLMGIGTTGNPTRFLGLVCDILGSGSHYTAICVGAVTALFIAATQYAAIFELNKK